MFRVSQKLRILKGCIRDFSKTNYSNIEKRVNEAHLLLLERQNEMLLCPTSRNAELECTAMEKWQTLATAEESFLLQRSRILWWGKGDASTSYFHRMVAARKAFNHIHYLIDDAGTRFETHREIESHCVDYFSNFMGGPVEPQMFIQEDINLLFNFSCSADDQEGFKKPFTEQDIKIAFFSLPRNKICGPDGYSSEFFTATWDIVGPEVTAAILEFFSSGQLLTQWNSTTLVLIPKIVNASHASEFRPISCLNTVYKVIAKLLAQRLKEFLPKIISQSQSAFLPGRLLAENVLLATDLVKGYGNANLEPKAMLKVDLKKVFDSIRWDFILATLRALAVPEKILNWIHQCISTPTFTVSINGGEGDSLKAPKE